MELDDFKNKWQKNTAQNLIKTKKDMAQLQNLLQDKTLDAVSSLKLKYEKIISILLGSMLVSFIIFPIISDRFTYPGSVNGFIKVLFLYLLVLIFYWQKFRNVNHLVLSENIKERLEQLLKKLHKDLRLEVGFVCVLFIAAMVIGRFFYGKGITDIFKPDVIIAFGLSIFFTGAMLYVIINRYQKQIKELQSYLAEYNESR